MYSSNQKTEASDYYKEMCFKSWAEKILEGSYNKTIKKIHNSIKDENIKEMSSIILSHVEEDTEINYDVNFNFYVENVSKLLKINDLDLVNLHLINQNQTDFNDYFIYVILKNYGLKNLKLDFDEQQRIKCIISGLLPEYIAILKSRFNDLETIEELLNIGYPIKKYEELKEIRLKSNKLVSNADIFNENKSVDINQIKENIEHLKDKLSLFENKIDGIISKIDNKS